MLMAQLQVDVVEARNLKNKDELGENDAFAEIYLDNIAQKQKTKVKRNSNNPIWNETLFFNHFQGQDILNVDVYDEDVFMKEKIGTVQIDLNTLYSNRYIEKWFQIKHEKETEPQGEIHLRMYYSKLEL